MELPKLTKAEQHALLDALARNFGPCTCRSESLRCDGHRFLAETEVFGTDRQEISRVARLVMYRRMASMWTTGEFARPFSLEPEPLPESEPLPADLFGPPSRESPVQGDDSSTLPW